MADPALITIVDLANQHPSNAALQTALGMMKAATPVTIGLDVLEALIEMAKPTNRAQEIMLVMAYNASMEAKYG